MLEIGPDPIVKVSVSIRQGHLDALDVEAEEAGIKRSAYLQQVLEEHFSRKGGEHWRYTWLPRRLRARTLMAEEKRRLIDEARALAV